MANVVVEATASTVPVDVTVADLEAMYAVEPGVDPYPYEADTSLPNFDEIELRRDASLLVNGAHYRSLSMRQNNRAKTAQARNEFRADPTFRRRLKYVGLFAAGVVVSGVVAVIVARAGGYADDLFDGGSTPVDIAGADPGVAEAPEFALAAATEDDSSVGFAEVASAIIAASAEVARQVSEAAQRLVDPTEDQRIELPAWNPDTGEGSIWGSLEQWATDHGYEFTEAQLAEVKDYVLDYQNGVVGDGKGMSETKAENITQFLQPSDDKLFAAFDKAGAQYNPDAVTEGMNVHPDDRAEVPPTPTTPPPTTGGEEEPTPTPTPTPVPTEVVTTSPSDTIVDGEQPNDDEINAALCLTLTALAVGGAVAGAVVMSRGRFRAHTPKPRFAIPAFLRRKRTQAEADTPAAEAETNPSGSVRAAAPVGVTHGIIAGAAEPSEERREEEPEVVDAEIVNPEDQPTAIGRTDADTEVVPTPEEAAAAREAGLTDGTPTTYGGPTPVDHEQPRPAVIIPPGYERVDIKRRLAEAEGREDQNNA